MKKITIVSPCYNEEGNIKVFYEEVMANFPFHKYNFELLFIDNKSTDQTRAEILKVCFKDKRVKAIFNSANFGQLKSPYYALMQSDADATILMVSDLQDPPNIIPKLISEWEAGFDSVMCTKTKSEESWLMYKVRTFYYNLVESLSESKQLKNFTGFGLYDKKIIEVLRILKEPVPYFRGLVLEIGFQQSVIEYTQTNRKSGFTKNNFLSLFDVAILGICSSSRTPIRLITILGLFFCFFSFLASALYLILKLFMWNEFPAGVAPLIIGGAIFASLQIFILGMIGEYIGIILVKINDRPLVIEEKRINFNE